MPLLSSPPPLPSGSAKVTSGALVLIFCRFQFVAQPNCQQLLASRWYDEFPGWRRRHWAGKFLTCVFIGLLYPAFALCYLVAPKSRYGLFIRKPFIKFICHTASYLTFLFLLLLASQHVVTTEQDRQGPAPTTVEWMILPWVLGESDPLRCQNPTRDPQNRNPSDQDPLGSHRAAAAELTSDLVCVFAGFIWAEVKQMWDGGFQDYVHDWWNLMDFVMNSLYLATISLKMVAYAKVPAGAALRQQPSVPRSPSPRSASRPGFVAVRRQ